MASSSIIDARTGLLNRLGQGEVVSAEEQQLVDAASLNDSNEFVKGLRRFGYSAVATSKAFAGQLIEPVAPSAGRQMIQDAYGTIERMPLSTRPKYESFDEARQDGLRGLGSWAAGAAGEGLPSTALMLAGGLAGRGIGALAGRAGLGQAVGGIGTMIPLEAGETTMNLNQDPVAMQNTTPAERLALSLGRGGVNAALENIVPQMVVAPRLLGQAARIGPGLSNALRNTALVAGQGATGEYATEFAQDLTGQLAQNIANPATGYDLSSANEAGLAGAVTGALTGGVGGAAQGVYSNLGPATDALRERLGRTAEATRDRITIKPEDVIRKILDYREDPRRLGEDFGNVTLGALNGLVKGSGEARKLAGKGLDKAGDAVGVIKDQLDSFLLNQIKDPETRQKYIERSANLEQMSVGDFRDFTAALQEETGRDFMESLGAWATSVGSDVAKGAPKLFGWVKDVGGGFLDAVSQPKRGKQSYVIRPVAEVTKQDRDAIIQGLVDIDPSFSDKLKGLAINDRRALSDLLISLVDNPGYLEDFKGSEKQSQIKQRMLDAWKEDTGTDLLDVVDRLQATRVSTLEQRGALKKDATLVSDWDSISAAARENQKNEEGPRLSDETDQNDEQPTEFVEGQRLSVKDKLDAPLFDNNFINSVSSDAKYLNDKKTGIPVTLKAEGVSPSQLAKAFRLRFQGKKGEADKFMPLPKMRDDTDLKIKINPMSLIMAARTEGTREKLQDILPGYNENVSQNLQRGDVFTGALGSLLDSGITIDPKEVGLDGTEPIKVQVKVDPKDLNDELVLFRSGDGTPDYTLGDFRKDRSSKTPLSASDLRAHREVLAGLGDDFANSKERLTGANKAAVKKVRGIAYAMAVDALEKQREAARKARDRAAEARLPQKPTPQMFDAAVQRYSLELNKRIFRKESADERRLVGEALRDQSISPEDVQELITAYDSGEMSERAQEVLGELGLQPIEDTSGWQQHAVALERVLSSADASDKFSEAMQTGRIENSIDRDQEEFDAYKTTLMAKVNMERRLRSVVARKRGPKPEQIEKYLDDLYERIANNVPFFVRGPTGDHGKFRTKAEASAFIESYKASLPETMDGYQIMVGTPPGASAMGDTGGAGTYIYVLNTKTGKVAQSPFSGAPTVYVLRGDIQGEMSRIAKFVLPRLDVSNVDLAILDARPTVSAYAKGPKNTEERVGRVTETVDTLPKLNRFVRKLDSILGRAKPQAEPIERGSETSERAQGRYYRSLLNGSEKAPRERTVGAGVRGITDDTGSSVRPLGEYMDRFLARLGIQNAPEEKITPAGLVQITDDYGDQITVADMRTTRWDQLAETFEIIPRMERAAERETQDLKKLAAREKARAETQPMDSDQLERKRAATAVAKVVGVSRRLARAGKSIEQRKQGQVEVLARRAQEDTGAPALPGEGWQFEGRTVLSRGQRAAKAIQDAQTVEQLDSVARRIEKTEAFTPAIRQRLLKSLADRRKELTQPTSRGKLSEDQGAAEEDTSAIQQAMAEEQEQQEPEEIARIRKKIIDRVNKLLGDGRVKVKFVKDMAKDTAGSYWTKEELLEDIREKRAGLLSARKTALAEGDKLKAAKLLRDANAYVDEERLILEDRFLRGVIRIAAGREQQAGLVEHETLHAAFHFFFTEEERRVLGTAFQNGLVGKRLRAYFKDQPNVLKAIDRSAEEAAAYGFQLWMIDPKSLQLGERVNTMFEKVKEFFRKLLGILTIEERAQLILNDLASGRRAERDSSALAKELDKDRPWSDRAKDAAREYGGYVVQLHDVLLGSTYQRLLKTENPALVKIAKLAYEATGEEGRGGMIQRQRQQIKIYVNKATKIFGDLTDEELKELHNAKILDERPKDAKLTRKWDQLNELYRELYEYQRSRGVELKNAGVSRNYYPLPFDPDKVKEKKDEFLKMLAKYPEKMETLKKTPEELWEGITSYIERGEDLNNVMGKDGEPVAEHARTRSLDFLTREDRRPFMADEPVHGTMHYIKQAVRQAEYVNSFGMNGKEIEKLREEAVKEYGATPDQMKLAKDYMDGLLGNKEVGMPRELKDLYGAISVYQNYRLLPFSLFSSLVDPLGIGIRSNSVGDSWETFTYSIKNLFKEWKKEYSPDFWETFAADWGIIEAAGTTSQAEAMYDGITLRGTTKKLNDQLFKYNLLNGWIRNNTIMAVKSAQRFFWRASQDKFGAERSQRYLEELGLTKDDIVFDEKLDRLRLTKEELMDAGKSEEQAAEIEAKLRSAVEKFVRQSLLNPSAAELPNWASNPYLAPIAHLKTFVFAFNATIIKRLTHEMSNGNYTPVLIASSYVPAMIAADFMKDMVSNFGEEPPYKKNWTAADYLFQGVQRSGLTGTGSFFLTAQEDMLRGGAGFESALGPTYEQARKGVKAFASGSDDQVWNWVVKSGPGMPIYDQFLLSQGGPAQ